MARRATEERRRRMLEKEYRRILIKALTECADGWPGLFAASLHLLPEDLRARIEPQEVHDLMDMAGEIAFLRSRLGYERFELHETFMFIRAQNSEHAPGEPKRAQVWLDELLSKQGSEDE
jgi:hypothetical protein